MTGAQERRQLFECPLFLPKDTVYAELGVAPESLTEEIRDAKTEALVRVDEERSRLEKALAAIERTVPGLAEARNVIKQLAMRTDTPHNESERARARFAEAEAKAMRADPRYREMRRRVEELERQGVRINQITIDNPDARRQYDEQHAPLGLMKLADAVTDSFVETRLALVLLRREMSGFLTAAGEETFHPSDLTREDFRSDHAFNPLLD